MSTTQHSFITNQEKLLSEVINGIFPKSNAIDILVGYFYYSGFDLISEGIKDKKVRILVGLDVDVQISSKVREIDQFMKTCQSRGAIKEDYFNNFKKLFNDTDFFDSDDKQKTFKLFHQKIFNGTLEIRKTEDPCHAKMYLFEYSDLVNEGGEQPGTVITGSSNLSHSGLAGRVEINARFSDKQSYIDGKKIFDQLWDSSVVIVDSNNLDEFDDKVIKHIWYEKIGKPYLMYIRVLHEYFSIPTQENILTPHDITDGKFYNLKYQTDAIQIALNAMETHHGVIVADVVGLGKSIIGSAVARNMQLKTIVVAPPHLKTQWEEYATEFKFPAAIFSSGQIESALLHFRRVGTPTEKFLIIVDEAHKYRNEYTQDYAHLHNLCLGNKVMLLTATPFNNRPEDIYSMLKLFQIPEKSTLRTVENLGSAFKELIRLYAELTKQQREGKITEDEVKKEAQQIANQIRSIIAPLVLRRSRLDLEQIPEYKKDLEIQKIQPLIPNDPIELGYDLGTMATLYTDTLEKISPDTEEERTAYFKSARYQPISYVIEEKKTALEEELNKKYGVEFNLLIGRQVNIAKFMRRLLVRRFESSMEAFRTSLSYMIDSSEHIIQWVEKRKKVPVYKKGQLPVVEDFYETTDDNIELTDVFDKYTDKGFFEIDGKYLRIDDFLTDVKADLTLLKEIQTKWFGANNQIQHDPKVESFKLLLRKMRNEDPQRKIIVFTEFADTADYLGRALENENLGVFKYTSKDASQKNKETIRSNFDAGYDKEMQENNYQVLVATDAISEGYNLHRAGAIFNYDIPYNPTRVIQRIGRINRINKKMFHQLFIYNYFPTAVGESETRIKEIAVLKMAMIHAIMGEDTKALTKEEELQAFFKEQYNRELNKSEEASWDNKYRTVLNQLKGTEIYKQALEIAHRTRCARKADKDAQGVLLMGKKGNDLVFKLGNSATEPPIMVTTEQALALFEAVATEEGFAPSKVFDTIYQNVKTKLFKGTASDTKQKDRLNAFAKIKTVKESRQVSPDYIEDLLRAIENDALAGFELRLINQLTPKQYVNLPNEIDQAYLNRIIHTANSVDDGAEVLILAEEFLS